MRTIREQLQGLELDIARSVVYNAGQLSISHNGRLGQLWPVTYSETHKGRYPSTNHTQECVKVAQTRLRKLTNGRSYLTCLRKGILNSIVMRKVSALKEKQYGKN